MLKLIHAVIFTSLYFSMTTMGGNNDLITIDARINGQPVLLAFDTSIGGPILFRKAAERLKLEVKEPSGDLQPGPGRIKISLAKDCLFELGNMRGNLTFGVADLPGFIHVDIDGLIGWGVISENIVEIIHAPNKLKIHSKLTIDPSLWSCYRIRSDLNSLVMQIPQKRGGSAHVLIDTRSQSGISLNTERWEQSVHSNQPCTLSALFYPGKGSFVLKEIWAPQYVLEGLAFSEVPVGEGADAREGIVDGGLDAILGQYALSCFSWVIDGPAGKIYVQPNDLTRIPEKYDYNRLGAVFVPRDMRTSNDLVVHVAEPGPAYDAGIRNGDLLLKIDDVDVTKWRTDPSVMPLSRFCEQSAGTRLNLLLARDGKKHEITVTLQEIFEN